MKELTEYLITIRHLEPKEILVLMDKYQEELKRKFPNDQDFGKYMRAL